MSFLVIGGGLALTIFALAYLRSGRFGVAVLAFSAGHILAGLWADYLAGLVQTAGVQLPPILLTSLAYGGLVLVPGVLVLLLGQKKQGLVPRPIAALILAVFVLTLLLPLFVAEYQTQVVYEMLDGYRAIIITAVLILGLLEALFSRHPKPYKPGKD